jgi:hypothetical protein
MARRRKGIPGLSFSFKRASGISRMKSSISRKTGVPLTASGRKQKLGSGCGLFLVAMAVGGAIGAIGAVNFGAWFLS